VRGPTDRNRIGPWRSRRVNLKTIASTAGKRSSSEETQGRESWDRVFFTSHSVGGEKWKTQSGRSLDQGPALHILL